MKKLLALMIFGGLMTLISSCGKNTDDTTCQVCSAEITYKLNGEITGTDVLSAREYCDSDLTAILDNDEQTITTVAGPELTREEIYKYKCE